MAPHPWFEGSLRQAAHHIRDEPRSHLQPGETVAGRRTSHTHEASTETFYIPSGEARCRVRDEETILKAGHCGYAPPGVSHAVHNIGQEDLHAISIFNPPLG